MKYVLGKGCNYRKGAGTTGVRQTDTPSMHTAVQKQDLPLPSGISLLTMV